MNSYAQASDGSRSASAQTRPMDRIGGAADRIEAINSRLDGILARYHGRPTASEDSAATISISYLSQIDRLHGATDLLDKLSAELAEIG